MTAWIDRLIELLTKLPFESGVAQSLIRLLRRLRAMISGGPFVDLYGCPNSKRTEKLQMQKRTYGREGKTR